MAVKFTNNSAQVKGTLNDAVIAYLHEAGGELAGQAARNSRRGSGQLAGSWTYKVDEGKGVCTVGSPLQNAIWEEFGTGQYALNGDGRKGWWVYVDDGDNGNSYSQKSGKMYTYQEALGIYHYLRKQGLDAHITRGKTPHRAFHRAFISLKPELIKRAQEVLKARMK